VIFPKINSNSIQKLTKKAQKLVTIKKFIITCAKVTYEPQIEIASWSATKVETKVKQ